MLTQKDLVQDLRQLARARTALASLTTVAVPPLSASFSRAVAHRP